ncbi:MAG: hypothetical protein V2J07_08160 [Anaerolineae bacterium]|jgi:hypothetical protein|nr:hypothetical protein [Anaerolineae bacterium]
MSEEQTNTPTETPNPTLETTEKQAYEESYSVGRVRFGLVFTLIGFMIFLLGARPGLFGLDRSPVIGFVQIAMFLVGLAIIAGGGFMSLIGLWGKRELSIVADIGSRMVATGFVVCVFSGMADIFGLGSHLPTETVPFFGDWQVLGVEIGQLIIAIGLVMMLPFHRLRKNWEEKSTP